MFRNALSNLSHPQLRVINTDLAPIYGSAIADIEKEGTLRSRCRHRPVQYLNNIIEQDHRAIIRRVNAKQARMADACPGVSLDVASDQQNGGLEAELGFREFSG